MYAQSPGNVDDADLILWLKADVGVREGDGTAAEVNDGVGEWRDNSPNDNDAENAVAVRRPIYRTNIINGNPALEFNGTKFLDTEDISGIGDDESFIIFLVFKQNSFIAGGNDALGTFIIDRPTATNNLTSFKIINTDKYFYQRREDDGDNLGGPTSVTPANTTSFVIADYYRHTTSDREGIYLNGAQDIDQACTNGDITGPRIRIGNHATNIDDGGINGYFAEIIVFDASLSNTERQRVESYLAIKYGITLTSTINYVRSDGTTIYPSTGSHSGYVNDIAGIGEDDDSGLDHDNSKSQNANSVVRVYNPDELDNGNFLVWGSNNGSLTIPNTTDVDGTTIKRRLSRVWRVAETGNVGNFTIEFDLSAVPGAKTQAALRLLIDRDGDGFTDNDRTPLSGTLAGNIFTVNVAEGNINNGDYFTIGTTNASTTPLPIELADFNVIYENPVVVASWQTASELDNDFFTLERAGDDLSFEELGTKPGAGTSKIPHNYSMIDSSPYEGRSYYRLKQTDFDGTISYSDTKHMFIEETEKKLMIYPNPNDGKNIKVSWGSSQFNLNHLEVINQQGKSIESFYFDDHDLREYSHELKHRLSPGLYVVRIHYNGKDEFVKLMVQP